IKHSAVPRDRAVLLTLWSLGALVLHEHVHRLLDVDFLAYDGSPQSLQRYLYPATELHSQGLVEEGTLDDLVASIGLNATQPGTGPYDKEQSESYAGLTCYVNFSPGGSVWPPTSARWARPEC